MVELKTILCDISNDYILPADQMRQLFEMIMLKLNSNNASEVVDS